jgi:hypothetical protein
MGFSRARFYLMEGTMVKSRTLLCAALAIVLFASLGAAQLTSSLKSGKAELQSAGALAFAPEGILLVGDSMGGAIFAIDTQDRTPSTATSVDIKGVGDKVAAMLGTTADQIMVNDLAVNPISHKIYLSISRGRGPTATPVIVRMDTAGKLEEVALENVRHAKALLPNAATGARQRPESITDLAFVDNQVIVAGLSSEEFSSNLRSIPFPFQNVSKGSSIEIWHGSHGRFETNSPVRTFVPYQYKQEQLILAAYTCTPLVKFPLKQLQPGSKVQGTTIAEMGAGNRPIDMIVYNKGGKDYLLMSNNSLGVTKMPTENLETYKSITSPIAGKAGVPYETLDLKGVEQLDKLDNNTAVVLQKSATGSIDIRSIALP